MADPRPQLGLFSDLDEPKDMHVVASHIRVRADGTEVFVGEHLRWNRGRTERRAAPRRPAPVPDGQLGLFGATEDPPAGLDRAR